MTWPNRIGDDTWRFFMIKIPLFAEQLTKFRKEHGRGFRRLLSVPTDMKEKTGDR